MSSRFILSVNKIIHQSCPLKMSRINGTSEAKYLFQLKGETMATWRNCGLQV